MMKLTEEGRSFTEKSMSQAVTTKQQMTSNICITKTTQVFVLLPAQIFSWLCAFDFFPSKYQN